MSWHPDGHPPWMKSREPKKDVEFMKHYQFQQLPEIDTEQYPFASSANVAAMVADATDKAVVDAIIKSCMTQRITDLYLIDRDFVYRAIVEQAAREKNPRLTMEELKVMVDPVWCSCETIEGEHGYWCLCRKGYIVTPGGNCFWCEEIPEWKFHRYKMEGEI